MSCELFTAAVAAVLNQSGHWIGLVAGVNLIASLQATLG